MAQVNKPLDDLRPHIVEFVEEADPALLLTSLALWRGEPELVDSFADAFREPVQTFSGPRLLGAAAGVHDVEPGAAQEIRALVLAEITKGTTPPRPAEVDGAAFQRLFSFLVNEPVRSEFVPMLREQGGFEPDRRSIEAARRPDPGFEVIIIGAGMSGLTAAVKLAEAGFSYKMFERENQPGGWWVVNRYPGAAVDTPSHYSLSFELNTDWNRYYPTGPEYLAYLQRVAEKYGINEHLHCNTTVLACEWNETRHQWMVTTEHDGHREMHRARAILTAVGFLNGPHKPVFPGSTKFEGTIMHSAEWDPTVSLEARDVVLVGAGCTAVQIAATTARDANEFNIVQRHRQWIVPARTGTPVSDAERWLLANVPYYVNWFRTRAFWFSGGSGANHALLRMDPEWARSHVSVSPANDQLMQIALNYIDDVFGDRPDLREKLRPDYPLLAKRLIMDPGYYLVLRLPNVHLHDGSIDHLEADAVVLSDGSRLPCDFLALATGFHAEWLSQIDIRGRDGIRLSDLWSDDPRAYLGAAIPGFPNFFMTCGPNSASNDGGHNLASEQQVHFFIEALQFLVEEGKSTIEPTQEAYARYNTELDAEIDQMVWGYSRVRPHQHNEAGRELVASPWTAFEYWNRLRQPDLDDFIVTDSADSPRP